MLARGMIGAATRPRVGLRLARNTIPAFGTVMRNFALNAPMVKRRDDVLSRPAVQAPRTRLNGIITPHRRFAFGSLPMSSVKQVKNELGATVNDVVMSLCARCAATVADRTRRPARPATPRDGAGVGA